jgi:AI-2 transport protein TqsA
MTDDDLPDHLPDESQHRPLRSYGRVRGRSLRAARAEMFQDRLPGLTIDMGAGRVDPKAIMPDARELWLEIGFGGGEHMAGQAAAHSDVLILGAEPFVNGLAKLVSDITGRGLSNVGIHPGDARELMAALPDASVDRAFILFPDPWPKARHKKRRLVQEDVIAELARLLKPGARLRFATDWADYADWTLERWETASRSSWTSFAAKLGRTSRKACYCAPLVSGDVMAIAEKGSAARNAIVFIAVVVGFAAVFWLRDILRPLILALFLLILIDGFARVLENRVPGFPRRFAMPVALITSVLMFAGIVFLVAENGVAFFGQMVTYVPKLHLLAVKIGGHFGLTVPPTLEGMVHQLNPAQYLGSAAGWARSFATDALFVLIYLGFLMASQRGFKRKLVTLFPTHDERDHAVAVMTHIRTGIDRYVWVQTITGLLIAGATWILMAIVHLDNALFWAFVIFLAAYVPLLGGAVGVLLPPLFALVQFDTWWQAALLFAGAEIIHFVVGNIVTPRMQGTSLNLDPVVVLLSLAFWSAIWGITGATLSSPLTVVVMVVLAQFPGTRWIAVLLSWNADPELQTEGPADPSRPPAAQAA